MADIPLTEHSQSFDAIQKNFVDLYGGTAVNAQSFGAKGDGVADDTAALQALITYIVPKGLRGFLPQGTYLISSAITIPFGTGWFIEGGSMGGTVIKQNTNNTPIFQLTTTLTWGWQINNIQFTWATQQTSSNTLSVAIYFNAPDGATFYEITIRQCSFINGYRAISIKATSNTVSVWGISVLKCWFGPTLAGAGVWLGCATAVGQPEVLVEDCYFRNDLSFEQSIYVVASDTVLIKNVEFNLGTYSGFSQMRFINCTVAVINCRVEIATVSGTLGLWSFEQGTATIINCQASLLLTTGSLVTFIYSVTAPALLNIAGLSCRLQGGTGTGAYLLPYGGIGIQSVTGIVNGPAVNTSVVTTDLRAVLGAVALPVLDTNVLSQDFTETQNGTTTPVNMTLNSGRVQFFNATLANNIVVNLPGTSVPKGMEFTIVRSAATPGAFTLSAVDVNGGLTAVIPANKNGIVKWRSLGGASSTWVPVDASASVTGLQF